jgi:hypothetical protein
MLVFNHLTVFALLVGFFNFGTPSTEKAILENPSQKKPSLFKCASQNGSSSVKCTIERNKILYYFVTQSAGSNRYDLKIEAVLKGGSSVVYSGPIFLTDKRSSSNEFLIQIPFSTKQSYTWKASPNDFLKATYNVGTKTMKFETGGTMDTYFDSKHGLSSDDVKQRLTPPNFDIDNVVKAVSAYFIMEYNKAISINFPKK